jgi:hypothetical protein
MENRERSDKFIRKLIQQQGAEKAPDHFTEMVMGKIKASPAIDDTPLLSTGTWIAIIAGLAAVITVIFAVDLPFFDKLFSSSKIQQVSMNIFTNGLFDSMSSFFKSFNFSTITLMIIIAAGGLFLLDRLLRRRFSSAKLLMI